MDLTHLHLLTNHLPILGTAFGALVLFYGIITKSRHTKIAAYLVFIVAAIGGIITFSTGEAAEEAVEAIAGISETAMETHEDAAKFSIILIYIMGILSLIGAFITAKEYRFFRIFAIAALLVSVITLGSVATTGFLGGKIRHTELGAVSANNPAGDAENSNGSTEDMEDDDD